jgi:DNA-binding response OmpR family regulator
MQGSTVTNGEARRDGRSRRVLIIEDDRDAAELLAMCLNVDGFETLLAHDGESGLDVARRDRPGVVVCDIRLPRLDGYEVARALRDEPGFEDCLLVAVTGCDDDARAARAGFHRCITKPIEIDDLTALIAGRSEGDSSSSP